MRSLMQLIYLLVVASCALGCGVGVHQTLLNRLVKAGLLTDDISFARAGVFLPDAFYDCLELDEAAEGAHWPPFLAAGAKVVAELRSEGIDSRPLEAMLIGVLSHQVADVSWHSLGLQQGILQAMTESEFNGDYDTAHTSLDVGGDMIQCMRLRASNDSINWFHGEWNWNAEHICRIFDHLGYRIMPYQLSYCMRRGKAALRSELHAAPLAAPYFSKQSILSFDQLEDYPIGGLRDMDAQTRECLPALKRWMQDPLQMPPDVWDICQVFEGKKPKPTNCRRHLELLKNQQYGFTNMLSAALDPIRSHPRIKANPENGKLQSQSTVLKGAIPDSDFGYSIAWFDGSWAVSAPDDGSVALVDPRTLAIKRKFSLPTSKLPGRFSSRLGAALLVIKHGSKELLLASAPGLSEVYVLDTKMELHCTIEFESASQQYGSSGLKLIGETLACDGNIVYIGAPKADSPEGIVQAGCVFEVFKEKIFSASGRFRPESTPLYGSNKQYGLFGHKLFCDHGSQTLYIGEPGDKKVHAIRDSSIVSTHTSEIHGFGGGLIATHDDQLAIGAPWVSKGSLAQCGSIVFVNELGKTSSIEGTGSRSTFGLNGLDINGSLFVASSHSHNEHGSLWKVNQGETTLIFQPHDAFGFGTALASNGTTIAVGCPCTGWGGQVYFIRLS